MSYTFPSRVRYSEIGENEKLTLQGIINYFQDCTTFHSEDVGLGMHMLQAKKRSWVLSSWQIVVERYPALGEEIEVVTWPYGFKGFLGSRNFLLKTRDGERLAYANTLWAFMDMEKGRPAVVTKDCIEGYELEPPLEMNYASRKIFLSRDSVTMESFPVRNYHLDTNHHVNNGQYVQMAREFIPTDYEVHQMRAEYKIQAVLGDIITPKVHQQGQTYTVALCTEQGEPYAVVEFSRKEIV